MKYNDFIDTFPLSLVENLNKEYAKVLKTEKLNVCDNNTMIIDNAISKNDNLKNNLINNDLCNSKQLNLTSNNLINKNNNNKKRGNLNKVKTSSKFSATNVEILIKKLILKNKTLSCLTYLQKNHLENSKLFKSLANLIKLKSDNQRKLNPVVKISNLNQFNMFLLDIFIILIGLSLVDSPLHLSHLLNILKILKSS